MALRDAAGLTTPSMKAASLPYEDPPTLTLNQPEPTSPQFQSEKSGGSDIATHGPYGLRHSGESSYFTADGMLERSETGLSTRKGVYIPPTSARWLFYQHTKKRWKDYKVEQNQRIEFAYQRGDSKVRIQSGEDGTIPMEIFFADMIQYDPISDNRRAVQRLGPDSTWSQFKRFLNMAYRSYMSLGKLSWYHETFATYQERRKKIIKNPLQGIEDEHEDEYDVTRLYNDPHSLEYHGASKMGCCCAYIAKSQCFFALSMTCVLLNSVWISYETDHNSDSQLYDADLHFIVIENFFCAAFTLELTVRFFAFRRKRDAFTDTWFRFDFVLVTMMTFETWLMPLGFQLAVGGSGTQSLGDFSVFRLARLLRLSRMTRLLRAVPEVVTLLRGMVAAFRSVVFTLLLLVFLLYIFGIVFRSQVKGDSDYLETEYFSSVWEAMWVLLVHGTLLDNVSGVLGDIRTEGGMMYTAIFILFILLSSFTVLNMLIGILCEVVSKIKEEENSMAETLYLKTSLLDIMECYDRDGDKMIGKQEFELLMMNPEVIEALTRYGTDVEGLKTLSEVIFMEKEEGLQEGEEEDDVGLSFAEFIDKVMQLRGNHAAKVTDIVELREYMKQRLLRPMLDLKKGQVDIVANVEKIVKAHVQPPTRILSVMLAINHEDPLRWKYSSSMTIAELLREHGQDWATDVSKDALGASLTLGDVMGDDDCLNLFLGTGSLRTHQASPSGYVQSLSPFSPGRLE